MGQSRDVVVVGSGIIGASIVFQLARRGVRVTAVDRGLGPGEGSTGSSAAFIRCRYSNREVVRLACDSQRMFRSWREFTGLDQPRASYQETGVLWMLGASRETVTAERDALRMQGVAASLLSPAEVQRRFPAVSTCDVPFDVSGEVEHVCREGEAFLYEDEGGFIDPVGATQDLIDAARRQGGEVRFRSQVIAVRKSGGRVVGVELGDGTVLDSELVINAAGPWCNQLNGMAGLELDWTLTPTRIQVAFRDWPAAAGPIPITLDLATMNGYRLEASGAQVLSISGRPEDEQEQVFDPDRFKLQADARFLELNLAILQHRFPSLDAHGMPRGMAGLYTINRQDHHPILGPTRIEGFWVANGDSGHGLKLAPGVGSMIARAISGRAASFDTEVPISLFSPERKPLHVKVANVFA